MRLALLADLHANREATTACLTRLRKLGFDQAVLLGPWQTLTSDEGDQSSA